MAERAKLPPEPPYGIFLETVCISGASQESMDREAGSFGLAMAERSDGRNSGSLSAVESCLMVFGLLRHCVATLRDAVVLARLLNKNMCRSTESACALEACLNMCWIILGVGGPSQKYPKGNRVGNAPRSIEGISLYSFIKSALWVICTGSTVDWEIGCSLSEMQLN